MKAWDLGHLASKKACHQAEKMSSEIKEVIYKYRGEMPLFLAIHVLDIVKKEISDEPDVHLPDVRKKIIFKKKEIV